MYEYIVFDIDGTLIDSEKAAITSLQKTLFEETQRKYGYEELIWIFGLPGQVSLSKLGVQNIEEVHEKWMKYLKESHHMMEVFDGIEPVLQRLKEEGVTCGIVTSKTKEELDNDFVPFRLMPYFQHATCADDTKKHKPDPEPILKFIDVSGAKPDRTLYVGDTVYDMKCAHAAGVSFALAMWGAGDTEIPAEYKPQKPTDLLGLIRKGVTV